MKITKDTTISDILTKKPEAIEIMAKAGLRCIGCCMSGQESLEEGCKTHGMDETEIDNLVKEINDS
jgi:hybrid cluster-associated redox disulfide protein